MEGIGSFLQRLNLWFQSGWLLSVLIVYFYHLQDHTYSFEFHQSNFLLLDFPYHFVIIVGVKFGHCVCCI